MQTIILPCAKGGEQVLAQEAQTLGLQNPRVGVSVVSGTGDLNTAYQLCLYSRVASRVLWVLATGSIDSPQDLYDLLYAIEWDEHLSAEHTFAVHFNGIGQGINNTQFGAMKSKDAIVDRLRATLHRRPNIDNKNPDLSIDIHLRKGQITVALDLSGGALHQRGYRQAQGIAPLKESLAATLLYRANWAELAAEGYHFIDPLCGSATIAIEALLIAADIAPGLYRNRFGFEHWQSHIPAYWRQHLEHARQRQAQGLANLSNKFYAFDHHAPTLSHARQNLQNAGLAQYIHLEKRPLEQFRAQPSYGKKGLIATNPPYGERLGELHQLLALHATLGQSFKTFPDDWQMALISANSTMLKRLRLISAKSYQAYNGALESRIVIYQRANQPEPRSDNPQSILDPSTENTPLNTASAQAQMFVNRLRKNLKTYRKQAEKHPTNAYRIYDQDLPEYAVAIDLYADHAHVQEYAPPASIDPDKAQQRLLDILSVLPQILDIPASHIVLKTRQKQSGKAQYQKQQHENKTTPLIVYENTAQYLINLHDYLDTGLFLDHRLLRQTLHQQAKNKRVLNLFCYTASASVQAALGGASYTTSVDLSPTYLEWAQRNFDLNQLSDRHRLHRADVMQWLSESTSQFDLIFCDPPTFSNTKKEQRTFDVQSDHPTLIERCMARLAPNGILYFSNNYRGFKLAPQLEQRYRITNITPQTIDFDYKRRPKIHQAWRIQHLD